MPLFRPHPNHPPISSRSAYRVLIYAFLKCRVHMTFRTPRNSPCTKTYRLISDSPVDDDRIRRRLVAVPAALLVAAPAGKQKANAIIFIVRQIKFPENIHRRNKHARRESRLPNKGLETQPDRERKKTDSRGIGCLQHTPRSFAIGEVILGFLSDNIISSLYTTPISRPTPSPRRSLY